MDFGAIVLAGGRATRLGGADKAAVEIAGRTLLERCLAAVAAASAVVVVGDERPTSREVTWVREHPAYGGPVAGLYAGLDVLAPDGPVVVLAVDMPEVTAGTVRRLLTATDGRDGAVLAAGGRRHLAMAVRRDALERVRPEQTEGAAMRGLWSALDLADVPALGEEAHDIDVPEDLGPGG